MGRIFYMMDYIEHNILYIMLYEVLDMMYHISYVDIIHYMFELPSVAGVLAQPAFFRISFPEIEAFLSCRYG